MGDRREKAWAFEYEKQDPSPYIFYHGSDSTTPFKKFSTPEVWFDNQPRDYGHLDAEVLYRWKKPFVTQIEYPEDFGVTQEEAERNLRMYKEWGGEANPQSFENMRQLGYDILIDNEGYAALYPNRVKILRWTDREGHSIQDYHKPKSNVKNKRSTPAAPRGISGLRRTP